MHHKEQGRNRAERKFFYRELTGIWKDGGLNKQAYSLVKHVNISLSDVGNLTLIERNAYISLLKDENSKMAEEVERQRTAKT